MNTVAYCRVSTDKQEESKTIEMQKFKLIEYAAANKLTISKWYIDDGFSGKDLNRKAIQELLAEIKDITQILIYDQSRLTRNLSDLLFIVMQLKEYQVQLTTLSGEFDFDSPEGEFQMNILGSVDQYHRQKISSRVKHRYQLAKQKAEKTGKRINWGRKPKIKDSDFDRYVKQGIYNKTSLSRLLGCNRNTLYEYLRKRFGYIPNYEELSRI